MFIALIIYCPLAALAYPEYAVRFNNIRCTACHVSPVGGGPRNTYGKLFGAHGYKINPVLAQDYVSADFRALYYLPQRSSDSRDGMGVMSGSVAGNVALDEEQRIRLVLEHNVGGFAAGPYRDSYALFHFNNPNDGKNHWADSLMVGRFRTPFGIVTDEHRTYTRVQSATEWYTMETGFLFSGTPSDSIHYDLALINGENQTGQTLNKGASARWGSVANLRYMPGPIMLGASFSYYDREPSSSSRQAASFYTLISIGRWTNDVIPVAVALEHVRAKNWGSHLGQGFAKDSTYVSSVSSAQSEGWLASLEYRLNPRFVLIYKYDLLLADQNFPADFYSRHGLGFKWYVGPNVMIQTRTEFARATHPSEKGSTGVGGQSATYGLLQLSL